MWDSKGIEELKKLARKKLIIKKKKYSINNNYMYQLHIFIVKIEQLLLVQRAQNNEYAHMLAFCV